MIFTGKNSDSERIKGTYFVSGNYQGRTEKELNYNYS
jgi:hypothetical protein